jgi:uncharacterized membrane protein (Fun14 family)
MTEKNYDMSPSPVPFAKEILTTVAGFSTLSYVFGFLIINAFLISRGLIAHTLLSTKYIAAGICYVFFYVLASYIFVCVPGGGSPADEWDSMVSKRRKASENALQKKLAALSPNKTAAYRAGYERGFRMMFILGYAVGYAIKYIFYLPLLQLQYYVLFLLISFGIFYITASRITLALLPFLVLWTIVVTFGTSIGIDLWKRSITKELRLVPFFLVAVVGSTIFYGWWLYPNISQSIGGGMPLEAVFVVSKDGKDAVETTLGTELNSDKTPPVKMLFETSESFVVIAKHDNVDQVCQLKKDLVSGVIYQPAK